MEQQLFWMAIGKILCLALCAIFYRIGGWRNKLFRRFGCPVFIALANWKLLGLLSIPLMFGALSIGYGDDSRLLKWLKNRTLTRLVCGVLYALSFVLLGFANLWYWAFHSLVLVAGVALAGSQKFKKNAVEEETIIGTLVGLGVWY